jgi:multicomponent Na+:H+ antiporter subunit E
MSPNTAPPPRPPGPNGWRVGVRRVVFFAAIWWLLTGGPAESWLLGAPAIALATWISLTLWSAPPLSLVGIARFLPYFAVQSLSGASDVAVRALRPRMPLRPGLVRHRVRVPEGVCRVALANVISMLPGTLSADLIGDELVIHALDTGQDLHAMVIDLEPRIAAMFGVPLGTAAVDGARP